MTGQHDAGPFHFHLSARRVLRRNRPLPRHIANATGFQRSIRVCSRFVRVRAGACFLREARHEEGSLVIPNERRITPHRAKTGPTRRVARQMSPCGVAGPGKGAPLPASRALRNAARPGDIWRSNADCDETGTDPRLIPVKDSPTPAGSCSTCRRNDICAGRCITCEWKQ